MRSHRLNHNRTGSPESNDLIMKKKTTTGLICLTVALMLGSVACGAGNERYPWLTDLAEARELAAAEEMPLLIVFRCEP